MHRRIIAHTALALALFCAPSSADPRLAATGAVFEAWLDAEGASGVLVAMDGKTVIGHHEHGAKAGDIVELASLSKAITGLCVAALVNEDLLDWSDTFQDIYGTGPDISLANLVTHSGGLSPDGTQYGMPFWLDQKDARGRDVLKLIDMRGGFRQDAGTFSYNNENYALLGLAVEARTKTTYEDACRLRVLDPAGAAGAAAPRSGGFLPWGGWGMRVEDYARVMAHWFGPNAELAKDPFAEPFIQITSNLRYGLGMYFRPDASGYNFWHFGGLCFPRRFEVGTFAVTAAAGWTMVVAYDRCAAPEAVSALQADLVGAMLESQQ